VEQPNGDASAVLAGAALVFSARIEGNCIADGKRLEIMVTIGQLTFDVHVG